MIKHRFWVKSSEYIKTVRLGLKPPLFLMYCRTDDGIQVDGYEVAEREYLETVEILKLYDIEVIDGGIISD